MRIAKSVVPHLRVRPQEPNAFLPNQRFSRPAGDNPPADNSASTRPACVTAGPGTRSLYQAPKNPSASQCFRGFQKLSGGGQYERGFAQGKIEDLPAQKQRFYNFQRNSLVLVKSL
jgi:hypothetical protein